jgi:hypothetical protein
MARPAVNRSFTSVQCPLAPPTGRLPKTTTTLRGIPAPYAIIANPDTLGQTARRE